VETASLSPVAPAAAPEPAAAPAAHNARVAEGTKIRFTINQSLSTKTAREGDEFSGVVSRSVRQGDTVVIPEGSVIRGRVSHVQRPGRVKGRGELGLRFDELELPNGQTYDLSASLTSLDEGEKETVDEEGQVKSEGTKKRDAATIGAGAGIGAIIGAIAGGGKGAAIGAGGGAAAGTGLVLLTRGKDVELKRGSELAIQLDRPLTLTAL
jgi:type IV secretion system protein VirB10